MDFCTYLNEYNIHVIDYSGHIDMADGLDRIERLGKYFAEHLKDGDVLKILINAKGYINDNPETHDALAKFARTKFAVEFNNMIVFTAVLNDHYNCSVSENEHWFITREDAIKWLLEQST
jgi:hypothetical protein